MSEKKIFVSYCHCARDIKRLAQLKMHLAPLLQQDMMEVWDDTRIDAGDDWLENITDALETSTMAILLLSPEFLNSKFITNVEVPKLFEKRATAGMRLVGIVCTACGFRHVPHFARMQLLPKDAKPLPAGLADVQWVEIIDKIRNLLEKENKKSAVIRPTSAVNPSLAINSSHFIPSTSFHEHLLDLGIKFTHPSNKNISLPDLFVMPQLKVFQGNEFKLYSDESSLDYILNTDKLLISAPEKGGKTTLSKFLCGVFLQSGIVPLIITGNDLNQKNSSNINSFLEMIFNEQYSESQLERYRALGACSKALIIDDISTSKLDKELQKVVLSQLHHSFGHFIVFTHELYQLDGITQPTANNMYLLSFSQASLAEFTKEYQEKLIRKWLTVDDHIIDDAEVAFQVREIIRHVQTLTAQNFLPSIPFVILTVLQSFEFNRSHKLESGTYGYLYEILITEALSSPLHGYSKDKNGTESLTPEEKDRKEKMAREQRMANLDTKYNLLSMLAIKLYTVQSPWFSEGLIREVGEDFRKQYLQEVDIEGFKNDLLKRQIIHLEKNGYRFRYPYYYYYFVARYLSKRISVDKHAESVKNVVSKLVSELYKQDNAHILIMLCYLSHDQFVINKIIDKAKNLFSSQSPCLMGDDIQAFNDLLLQSHKVISESEIKDFLEQNSATEKVDGEEFSLIADDDPDVAAQINDSFKTIQILGQALRNFSGSLEADIKIRMAENSADLGLRLLGLFFESFGVKIADFAKILAVSIKKQYEAERDQWKILKTGHFKEKTDDDISRECREKVIELTHNATLGIIKHISNSIGSEDLKAVFREFLKDHVSHKIIAACIRLDHYRSINIEEIFALNREFLSDRNVFAAKLLRSLVVNYVLIGPSDWKVKQMLCSEYEIKYNEQSINKAKSKDKGKDRRG